MPGTQAIYADIEETLGTVPSFLREVPPSLLEGFWGSFKGFQMSRDTALDGKTKELIGLAVAATIPCEYCIHFHREAATLNGASEDEMREAIAMGGLTRMGSTILNGSGQPLDAFRAEVREIVEHLRERPTEAPRMA